MANYQTGNFQYVVPTTYNPLSLQERLPIVMLYKDAYDKRRQEYIDLADKAGKFDYLRTELPEDSKARQIYENYANGFNEVAKDFSRNGLNLNNGRDLLNYRRRYKSEIGRLEEASQRKKEDIAKQQAIALQDPTRMFSRDASLTSLDDYLDHDSFQDKSYSGALLAQQTSTAAKAVASSMVKALNGGNIDKYNELWKEQYGMDAREVADALQNPEGFNGNHLMNVIVDNVINSSGMPSWADASTLRRAKGYAAQGLWSLVGPSKLTAYENYGNKLAAKEASDMRLAGYKHQLDLDTLSKKQEAGDKLGLGRPHTDLLSVLTNGKIDPKYDRFVTKNGKLLDEPYLKHAFGGISPYIYDSKTKKWRIKTEDEFKQFIDKKYPTENVSIYNPYGIQAMAVIKDRAVSSFKDFRNMLKNAGITDNNIDIHHDTKKGFAFNPYSYNVVNTRLRDLVMNGAVNGWQDTGVFTLPLHESGERKLRRFINTHPDQVKELDYISSDGKNRTYNWKGKYSLGKDDSISQLNYDPFSNQMTAIVGDGKMVSIPMSILSVADRQNIQVQSNIMKTSPDTADAALAYQNVYDLFLGALEEYGTVDRSKKDYQ